MATNNVSQYVNLAKTLPPKLQRFFARYPPTQILNRLPDGEYARTGYQEERWNPFKPMKFLPTGRVHNPVYSLRRQADLVKLARENGVEELLPFTPKKTEEQLKHRVKYGLRVKGTGVDQKVKGKIHERQLATKYVLEAWLLLLRAAITGRTWANQCYTRMEKRREAMLKMPALIREWKAVCVLERNDQAWVIANVSCRSEGRTGPNGPNKEQGRDEAVLRDVQKCIKSTFAQKDIAPSRTPTKSHGIQPVDV